MIPQGPKLPPDAVDFFYALDGANYIVDIGKNVSRAPDPGLWTPEDMQQALGAHTSDFIHGSEVRGLLDSIFAWSRTHNKVFRTFYACDGPDMRRLFQMIVTPTGRNALHIGHRRYFAAESPQQGTPELSRHSAPKCSFCCRFRLETRWIDAAYQPSLTFEHSTHEVCDDCRDRLEVALGQRKRMPRDGQRA